MKFFLLLFFLCLFQVYSQTYLNINCDTGDDQYAEISKIVQISFNAAGDQMTIEYTDKGS